MPVPPGDVVRMANDRGLQVQFELGEDATPLQFVGTIHDWVNGMRNNHAANTLANTEWDRFVGDVSHLRPALGGGDCYLGFRQSSRYNGSAYAIFDAQDFVPRALAARKT